MTQIGKPVIFHTCVNNHYDNRCPGREYGTLGKKEDEAEDTRRKEIPPTNASVNITIGEYWGDDISNRRLLKNIRKYDKGKVLI